MGTVTSTTKTVDAVTAARTAAAGTFRGWWADIAAAGVQGKLDRLDDHSTGGALQTLQQQFADERAKGWVDRGSIRILTAPKAVVDGSAAKVTACVDLTGYQTVDARTGGPKEPRETAPHSWTLAEISIGGTWKVSDYTSLETPCAAG